MQKINKYIICSLILILSCDDEIYSPVNPASPGKPYYIIECEENEYPFLIRLDCGSIGCNEEDFILGYIFSNTNDTNYVREDEYVISNDDSYRSPDPVKYYGYYCANSDSVNYELWVGDVNLHYIQFYQIDKDNNGKYNLYYLPKVNTYWVKGADSERILEMNSPGNQNKIMGTLYFSE